MINNGVSAQVPRLMLKASLLILAVMFSVRPSYADREAKKSSDAMVASAFLVAPGYLITANHAIKDKKKLFVAAERDGTFTAAKVVGFSEDLDVALIRASVKGTSMTIGHWHTFPRGSETYVIGFPKIGKLVSEKRITAGIYNGEQRFGSRHDWFQLSAEIHKGNSGSPVIGADGKVYGVISHKLDAQQMAKKHGELPQNVNFALKSSKLMEFLAMYDVSIGSGSFNANAFDRPLEIFQKYETSIFLLLGTNR